MLVFYRKSWLSVIRNVIPPKHFTFVCNVITIFPEVVNFRTVQVSKSASMNSVPVSSKFLIAKVQDFFFQIGTINKLVQMGVQRDFFDYEKNFF